MLKKKVFIALFCFITSILCNAQTPEKEYLVQFGELITIKSSILKETRDIWVYLPPNYHDTYHQPARYPVLYILDGDIHFHSLSGLVQILGAGLNGTYVIPEMIVIAIPNTNRARDLAPTTLVDNDSSTNSYSNKTNKGLNFLKFIRDELIPKVDSSYRTMDYRTFIGQSLGGLTVINALQTIPETFNAYVAIEPSLWWDDKVLLKQIKDYFNGSDLKGKTFFLAQANTLNKKDSVNLHYESIKEMLTILETRNRSNLKWKYKYYGNDNHASVALVGEYDALRFIFEKFHAGLNNIFGPKDLEAHYIRLSEELKTNMAPPERVVQRFGQVAMSSQKYNLAQEYFQMNIQYYPNSASALADMGNLIYTKGLNTKAMEYYRSALSLDSDNEYLIDKIRSLKKEQ
jgi:predicted alpha/beta superfamily hydrolase